ncbi:uncharacterized protein [Amphiura filiformis]
MNPNVIQMPNMRSADPDQLFVCPYDPIHRVVAKRFPYHLMKCRKNWGGRAMSTCPFNARHIVPQPEFRHHVANCPDKACIEQDMAYVQRKECQDGSYVKGCTDIPAYNRKIPSPTEDWDREISAEIDVGYNPDDHLHPGVFRNLTGYTPAEKRAFHQRTGKFHYKTQEDVDTHVPGNIKRDTTQNHVIHTPTAVRPSGGAAPFTAQPQSTASENTNTTQHMRLPKQPPKAAVVAAAASLPNGRESCASKRGGRAIAANIFGAGAASYSHASSESMTTGGHHPVSTPMANSELQNGFSGAVLSNGVGYQPNTQGYQPSSAFRKPVVGVGRGLVPGLGRGIAPGIGRGLVSYSAVASLRPEPKVGLQQQQS